MNKKFMLWPLMAGFFVMGFGDIIGTVMNQVKAECVDHANILSRSEEHTSELQSRI